MFPIILDLTNLKVALVGGGDSALERLKALDEAGVKDVTVFADNFGKEFWDIVGNRLTTRMPNEEEIKSFSAIMVVDVSEEKSAKIAKIARKHSVMVNVENNTEACDFFYPSVVRRGDLIITVSTSGKSPTLARRVRDVIGRIFYNVWSGRVDEMAFKRQQWREIGLDTKEVAKMSNKYIDEKGWLAYEELVGDKEKV